MAYASGRRYTFVLYTFILLLYLYNRMENNICRCGNRPINPEFEDLCTECAEQISLRFSDDIAVTRG